MSKSSSSRVSQYQSPPPLNGGADRFNAIFRSVVDSTNLSYNNGCISSSSYAHASALGSTRCHNMGVHLNQLRNLILEFVIVLQASRLDHPTKATSPSATRCPILNVGGREVKRGPGSKWASGHSLEAKSIKNHVTPCFTVLSLVTVWSTSAVPPTNAGSFDGSINL
jgi:hypothetical protein